MPKKCHSTPSQWSDMQHLCQWAVKDGNTTLIWRKSSICFGLLLFKCALKHLVWNKSIIGNRYWKTKCQNWHCMKKVMISSPVRTQVVTGFLFVAEKIESKIFSKAMNNMKANENKTSKTVLQSLGSSQQRQSQALPRPRSLPRSEGCQRCSETNFELRGTCLCDSSCLSSF